MNIVITGASRGIGRAAAKQFDKPGNKLFLIATSEASFKNEFPHASLFGADLTRPERVGDIASRILEEAGGIDLFISNAGTMIMKKFEQMSEEEVNALLDLNLRSHLLLTRALLPGLRSAGHAQIIFMSSMAAKSSLIGESVYAATKSGITNFANVLRNELAPNIRVSAIHAWGVDTWGAPNSQDFIQPADVAATMEFIATRPATAMVESIDLSNPKQWRGGQAPWSPA